jgi:hypothetical protein
MLTAPSKKASFYPPQEPQIKMPAHQHPSHKQQYPLLGRQIRWRDSPLHDSYQQQLSAPPNEHPHFHSTKSKDNLGLQSPVCGTSPTSVNVPHAYPEFTAALDQPIQPTSGECLVSRNKVDSLRDKNRAKIPMFECECCLKQPKLFDTKEDLL